MLDSNSDIVRQDYLFSLMFKGSGVNGAWTASDWNTYYKNRKDYWQNPSSWINPDPETGWDLFAVHAGRLASHYTSGQQEEFVKDFGLVFAGIPYYGNSIQNQYACLHGPCVLWGKGSDMEYRSYLVEGNGGLSDSYIDSLSPLEDQSHHYAGSFYASYFDGRVIAGIGNFVRDAYPYNSGDIMLGNGAIHDAYLYYFMVDLADIVGLISQYSGQ